MRLGCLGCLTVLILMTLIGGSAWLAVRALQEPEFPRLTTNAADGVRAQQKIFDLVRRGAGRGGPGGEPVALSESELNAFLSRHLAETAEVPFSDIGISLPGGGIADFRGRLPLRHLLTEPPLSTLGAGLPQGWLERLVWLRVSTRARVEPGATRAQRRYLRLEVVSFAIGRQRLPATVLRLLLNPSTLRVLRWPMPEGTDAVTIETDRVVIRLAS